MAGMRVLQLAKEYGLTNREMLDKVVDLGIPAKSHASPLNDELAPFRISHEAIKNDTLDYKSAPRLSLSGLGDEKFILAKRGNELRRLATLIFDENRIIPEISMEFERPHTAVSYAEVGLGLCFLTDTVIKHSNACDNISVYLPETIYSELTVYTVYQAKNYIPNALREFLDFIAEELSAEPKT